MRIRADSTEYATATITADHDLDGKSIEVALPESGSPPETWEPAAVVSVIGSPSQRPATSWTATYRILIGPQGGAFTLSPDTHYDWTVRVADTPEVPVLRAGHVHVTET